MKRSATSIAEARTVHQEPQRAEDRETPAGKNV